MKQRFNVNSRDRLLRPTTLVLLIAAVGGLLWLLFPEVDFSDPQHAKQTDEVTLAYLRVVLQGRPKDHKLRLLVAGHELRHGHLERCRVTVAPLLGLNSLLGTRARLLALRLQMALYHRCRASEERPPGGQQCLVLRRGAIADLRRLQREPMETPELKGLARLGHQLGQALLTARLYDRLAGAEPRRRVFWYTRAAQLYQAALHHEQAVQRHLRASSLVPDRAWAMTHALRAVDVWVAADQGKKALALARVLLSRFPESPRMLNRTIDLALAQNKTRLAHKLGARLLVITPANLRNLRRQVRLELALGDSEAAFTLAQQLLALNPGSRTDRALFAKLARWTGHPDVSLQALLWLTRRGHPGAAEEAVALARDLRRPRALVWLLQRKFKQRQLTFAEMKDMVAALEGLGEPEQAAGVIKKFLQRRPRHRKAWLQLAYLEYRRGLLPEALAVRQKITKLFGPTPAEMIIQARLLWELNRPEEALASLRSVTRQVPDKQKEFWRVMGSLAWQLGRNHDALTAYQRLWRAKELTKDVEGERLVRLLLWAGKLDEALRVLWPIHERFNKPMLVLAAMDAAAIAGQYDELRKLLDRTRHQRALHRAEQYWLLAAALSVRHKKYLEAKLLYERALALDANSVYARLGWLWSTMELKNKQGLYRALRQWRGMAESEPEFWTAYAIALDRLGRPTEALEWYEREARANPEQIDVVAAYADALGRAGRNTAAWRLRRYMLESLQPQAHKAMQQYAKSAKSGSPAPAHHSHLQKQRNIVLAYADVVRRLEGSSQGKAWLDRLLTHGHDDPQVLKYAVSWHLSRQNIERARHWFHRQVAAGGRPSPEHQLNFALVDRDVVKVARILDQEKSLTNSTRVSALAAIGRPIPARDLARLSLSEVSRFSQEGAQLHASLQELDLQMADKVWLGGSWDSVGSLDIAQQRVRVRLRLRSFLVETQASHYNYFAEAGAGLLARDYEHWRFMLATQYRKRPWKVRLSAGMLLKGEEPMFMARLSGSYSIWSGMELKLEGTYGLPSEMSDAMRLAGLESGVKGGFYFAFTRRTDLSIGAAYRYFSDHDNEKLGQGLSAELMAGHKFSMLNPLFRVRLGGQFAFNDLAPTLPASFSQVVAPGTSIQAVLPDIYGTAGVGVSLSQENLFGGSRRGMSLRYLADAWLGWWWPANQLTYRFEAGLGWRFLTRHEIIASVLYSNQSGGTADQGHAAVVLKYDYSFAK